MRVEANHWHHVGFWNGSITEICQIGSSSVETDILSNAFFALDIYLPAKGYARKKEVQLLAIPYWALYNSILPFFLRGFPYFFSEIYQRITEELVTANIKK